MKLMSGTFSKPDRIMSIAIKYLSVGWIEYPDQEKFGTDIDVGKELLIIVRKYKGKIK